MHGQTQINFINKCGCGYGGYCYGVVVLNLFIMVLCGFVIFVMCGGVYVWVFYCMDV